MSQANIATKPSLIRRLFARFNIVLPSLPTAPPAHEPAQGTLLQLAALIGLAVAFHFSIADLVIASFALLIFVLKIILLYAKNKLKSQGSAPPQIVVILLTIISIALIILLYGGWNGQRAGISFLVLLVSLKFLESRILRDYYVVCLILYFLAASSFLFNASITNIAIIMIYTLAVTGIMLKLSSPSPINWKKTTTSAGGIVSKSLPLALILFFFFPRIHGSFGFLPSQDHSFDSELSNSLVVGDIASSAFNNALAFRVEFEGLTPESNQLYWRSKVMPNEENFVWTVASPSAKRASDAQLKADSLMLRANQPDLTRYTILHEESTDLFLPYLDYVAEFSRGRFNADYSIWHRARTGSFSYTGGSTVGTSIAETLQLDTQQFFNPKSVPSARTQALLSQWKQLTTDPLILAQNVLDHFTNNEFYYSLYPPGLGESDQVDEFLFNTRTGYCEHYASVFSILMRWLGIPSRVVVGYQGGLANQSGQYLEIRYSDAHAWSEILVDQTWVRVDPTAAISPERIEFGMDAFMSLWGSSGANGFSGGTALSNYLNPTGMNRYYRLLRDNWNNIGYQWKKWVIDYDADTQQELLAKFGLEGEKRYGTLVLIMFGSIGAILLFYFWRMMPRRVKHGEAQRYYLKFIDRFKRAKIIKNAADTPNEFAQKAIAKFPHHQQEISDVTDAYIQLRYGRSPFELTKFKQLVKKFNLNTKGST